MINAIRKIFVFGCLCAATALVYGQVAASVNGGEGSLLAGAEFSRFNPDFGGYPINGIGATFDLNVTPKIGAVGEVRWLRFGNSGDFGETQSDYLIGGKYRFYQWNRFDFDAKFLIGGVWIKFPNDVGSGSYFAYVPGAFADYRLTPRFRIRADYEYQLLPSAPNIPGSPNNGMTPRGYSFGVEYTVLR